MQKNRELFLQRRADFHSFHQNILSSTIVSRILQAEKIKSQFKHIREKIKYKNYMQISKLKIPINNTEWMIVDEDETIKREILQHTKEIFNDINGLPIANGNVTNYIGKFSENQGTEEILSGRINRNNLDLPEPTLSFLSNLKRPDNIQSDLISSEMSTEEFISTFRKANEYTTSSPSGIHYFHYMAASYDQELAAILALKLSLPFQFTFKVDLWTHAHHIILPKTDPPQLHKLRNIQIIEADFNSYFKCKINKKIFLNEKVIKFLQNRCMGE